MTITAFKALIKSKDPYEVACEIFGGSSAEHVSVDGVGLIRNKLSSAFNAPTDKLSILVSGSAKLGFSIIEKKDKKSGFILPRYRSFRASSDIDTAVISAPIFDLIWHELARFYHQDTYFPSGACSDLGRYLPYGWLRPDKFPAKPSLIYCNRWWEIFNELSVNPQFGPRKVRGGLFYSEEQFFRYQARALSDCKILP